MKSRKLSTSMKGSILRKCKSLLFDKKQSDLLEERRNIALEIIYLCMGIEPTRYILRCCKY